MNEHILDAIPTLEEEISPTELMVQSVSGPVLWGLCVLLVLLVALVVWLVMRHRKRGTALPALTPRQLAERALDVLAEQLPPLREGSLRLSMILRTFLTGQTQDPALFETHEEFSRRMDALSTVPRSCHYATRDLLERLAEQKYAGNSEHEPQKIRGLIEETRTLLADITRAQTEEEAAAAEVSKMKHKMS